MGFDRIRIKENAKTHYRLNKWNNVLVMFIYLLVTGGGCGILSGVLTGMMAAADIDDTTAPVMMIFMYILIFGVSIFGLNVLAMGLFAWYQKAIHREKTGVEVLFDGFSHKYWDNVLTMFLKNLFICLWTLLFYVPGIVKMYSYAMTEYIKMENPDIPANRAIELSRRMMDGHKWDLFVLDLSFLGWNILSSFTYGILMILYVGPYYYAARAFAYEEIKAEAIASGRVSAEELSGVIVY
ncbi:MAG: DUF975 family protein [Oscillospiraceae bacterium]